MNPVSEPPVPVAGCPNRLRALIKLSLANGDFRGQGYLTWEQFCAVVPETGTPESEVLWYLEQLDAVFIEILFEAEGEVDAWLAAQSGGYPEAV